MGHYLTNVLGKKLNFLRYFSFFFFSLVFSLSLTIYDAMLERNFTLQCDLTLTVT